MSTRSGCVVPNLQPVVSLTRMVLIALRVEVLFYLRVTIMSTAQADSESLSEALISIMLT
jgi:hypothetical protein